MNEPLTLSGASTGQLCVLLLEPLRKEQNPHPAVEQGRIPRCSDTAPSTQEMQQLSISELQILLPHRVWGEQVAEVSPGLGRCLHQRVLLGALRQLPPPPPWQYSCTFGHWGVMDAAGEGFLHGTAPFCAKGQGEHSSHQPCTDGSPIPTTLQLPRALTSSFPSTPLPQHPNVLSNTN